MNCPVCKLDNEEKNEYPLGLCVGCFRDTFILHKHESMKASPVEGWGIEKKGRLQIDFWHTKKSMLIGYDLIPLRGLAKCERALRKAGMIPVRVRVHHLEKGEKHNAWAVKHGNKFVLLEWSALDKKREGSLHPLCNYLSLPDGYMYSDSRGFYWRPGRSTKIRRETMAKIDAMGFSIVKVVLEKV